MGNGILLYAEVTRQSYIHTVFFELANNVKDLILGYYDDKGKLQCRGKVCLGILKEERQLVAQYAATNAVKRPWFPK